jgi:hypothetical protein
MLSWQSGRSDVFAVPASVDDNAPVGCGANLTERPVRENATPTNPNWTAGRAVATAADLSDPVRTGVDMADAA